MFGVEDYWAFVVAVIVFLAIPGVGNLAIITSTSKGRIAGGLAATLGVIVGDQVLMWLAVAGVAAVLFDFRLTVSTPPGYEVEKERINRNCEVFADPMQAARGADLVTTDVWTSMGFEAENEARRRAFQDWQVDAEMMRAAKKDALFMHCLPAHRGEEVAAEVIDGAQSAVWEEAENRLHTQKALLEFLLLGQVKTVKKK